jgi:hypothetical protein
MIKIKIYYVYSQEIKEISNLWWAFLTDLGSAQNKKPLPPLSLQGFNIF